MNSTASCSFSSSYALFRKVLAFRGINNVTLFGSAVKSFPYKHSSIFIF